MRRYVAIALLMTSLQAAQAVAGDLDTSIRAAAKSLASQSRTAARGENPYHTPGLIMLGVGGGVLLYGLVNTTGVDCSGTATATKISYGCGTTHSSGVIIAGAAMAGVGTYLLWKSQQNKNRGPEV